MDQYVNGSDLLMKLGGNAIGHCTSHTSTFNTETKDVAVKPLANQPATAASLYKTKRIVGLGVQVKADGLCFYSETESGLKVILAAWALGQHVHVDLFERENAAMPYVSGNFVITSLENTAPAGEDATYSVTLDNDGPVVVDATKLDLLATSSGTAIVSGANAVSLQATAGSANRTYAVSDGTSVSAVKQGTAAWLTISTASNKVTFSATANTTGSSRSATVRVSGANGGHLDVTVTQAAQ